MAAPFDRMKQGKGNNTKDFVLQMSQPCHSDADKTFFQINYDFSVFSIQYWSNFDLISVNFDPILVNL